MKSFLAILGTVSFFGLFLMFMTNTPPHEVIKALKIEIDQSNAVLNESKGASKIPIERLIDERIALYLKTHEIVDLHGPDGAPAPTVNTVGAFTAR